MKGIKKTIPNMSFGKLSGIGEKHGFCPFWTIFLPFFGYLSGHTNLVRLENIEGQFKRYNPMIIVPFYYFFFLFLFLSSHFDFHPLFINFRLFFDHFGGDHIIGVPPISVNFVKNDDK